MNKKTRKRKWRAMRFRKGDVARNLLAACSHWIKARGGTAVVIGGIDVQTWPPFDDFRYGVVINCVGKKPEKPLEKRVKEG